MNTKTIKKNICKAILAGLIASMMPLPLYSAQSPQTQFTQDDKSLFNANLSDQDLENIVKSMEKRKQLQTTIKTIKAVTKIMNNLKIVSGMLSTASSLTGLAIGATETLLGVGVLISAMVPGIGTAGATVLAGTGTVISVSGLMVMAILGIAPASLWFLVGGSLDSVTLLASMGAAKNLDRIEQKYPGILTAEQLKVRNEFNKLLQGSIAKGVITGIRIKNSIKKHVALIFEKHPNFKHPKDTKKYLERSRQAFNLQQYVKFINLKIMLQTQKRNTHKNKWSLGYNIENTKLLSLKYKPKFLMTKVKLKELNNKIAKFEMKHPEVQSTANKVAKKYIKEANAIAVELLKK
ncbi:hypothetical protein KAH94_01340 [bacterium]|nr:hypothetical protein [bacterium]